MKLNKIKQILKNLSKYFLISFSVLLTVFSISLTPQKVGHIEKSVSLFTHYQQNAILQTPKESNEWVKKIVTDMNKLNYNPTKKIGELEKEIENVKEVSRELEGSISNGYHKGSHIFDEDHTMTFEFKLKINDKYVSTGTFNQWIDDNDSNNTKWFTLSGMKANYLRPSDNIQIDLTRVYVKGHYSWFAGLTIPKVANQADFRKIIQSRLSPDTKTFNINEVKVYLGYDGSNESGWNNTKVEVTHINKIKFNISQKEQTFSSVKNELKYHKIFMSNNDLKNTKFNQDQLKAMVKLIYGESSIGQNRIKYNSISLNRKNKSLDLNIKKITAVHSNQKIKPIKLSIPIITLDFNYLLEVSVLSSSYLEHLPNGDTRYHSTKPITRVKLSENFSKILKIYSMKEALLKKIDQDNWRFINTDRKIAISKINDLSLNIQNYENIFNAYSNSHDSNILRSLSTPAYFGKYISANNIGNVDYEDFLYILSKVKISFEYGSSIFTKKDYTIQELANGINLSLTDKDIQNSSSKRTNWNIRIKNLKINSSNNLWNFNSSFKIDIPDYPLENYDLKLKYTNPLQNEITHQYLFQPKGIDISKNISFIMEDGSILDQDFKVIETSKESQLKLGDTAYIATRYWTTLKGGEKEYLTLIQKNNVWYSPKYKLPIIQLTKTFNPKKIEYLFNQELQLIINPYASNPINANTSQSFGIEQVTDEANGSVKILEDWNDGKWSHTTDSNGKASFDGIFGADTNGYLDGRGRLKSGKHHINVTLQRSTFTGLRNDFIITIDKDPVKTKVKSPNGELKEFLIRDQNSQIQRVYSSNGPINIKVNDTDIKQVTAQFIDHNGNWYELPIKILSKKIDGNWVQTISTTIDYAGFAKLNITDQAGNGKTLYFWLQQRKNNQHPEFDFANNSFIDNKERIFSGNKIHLASKTVTSKISSPLAEGIQIQKQELKDGVWENVNNNNDYSTSPFNGSASSKEFGRTIDSSKGVLKYAGDELRPFLGKSNNSWPMINKRYTFLKPGLYKLVIKSRIIGHELVEQYVYIKNNNINFLKGNTFTKDLGNFKELPHDKKPITNQDETVNLTSKLHLNIPSFIIKEYKVEYSLLWYSEFHALKNPNLNFSKEGKYKIYILDIYGNKYEYEILVLNKGLSTKKRLIQKLIPIYSTDKNEDTAFWKGKNIWNYWRFEDEDHAKWEHTEFIKKAIKGGLNPKDAEALFKHLKKRGDWDGISGGNNSDGDFNFKHSWDKWKAQDPKYKSTSHISKSSLTGIIVGSSLGGLLIASSIGWLVFKRFKSKRIK